MFDRYRNVFALLTFFDAIKLVLRGWLRRASLVGDRLAVRVRKLAGQKVLLRLNTSDLQTAIDTFLVGYHRPPSSLRENATIVDLGSNIGLTIVDLNNCFVGARIIGVEMDAGNFEILTKNVERISNCTAIHAAISGTSGVVFYETSARNDAFRISDAASSGGCQVRALTIGQLFHDFALEIVDYLKVDIEGEELRIFAAHEEDLDWLKKVGAISVEVHGTSEDLSRIIDVLNRHGFLAWKSEHHWCTVLGVNNSLGDQGR